jgi:hypothetical protein
MPVVKRYALAVSTFVITIIKAVIGTLIMVVCAFGTCVVFASEHRDEKQPCSALRVSPQCCRGCNRVHES